MEDNFTTLAPDGNVLSYSVGYCKIFY